MGLKLAVTLIDVLVLKIRLGVSGIHFSFKYLFVDAIIPKSERLGMEWGWGRDRGEK